MGVEPPFIYDRPSTYTFGAPTNRAFNPRAATQASWASPPPKVKIEGPLINFNKHPDSYISVPYGNLQVQPMNPNTAHRVRRARRLQLLLRVLALFAAVGCLFCVITIRKTTSSAGWLIRVGPAVALVHTVYATYHFCRHAASRPPGSTYSYQIFAGITDSCLIPFFAFSAYMAWTDYSTNAYEWDTIFSSDVADHKVIESFFCLCAAEGGLFVLSLFLDIYLALMFRKIAELPPDMNPLEEKDNLTARPRHKRNKSDLLYEKHLSDSTLVTQRFSQQSSPAIAGRRMPFMHTRTDSADKLTLYGSEYAKDSRASLRREMDEGMRDPYGARSSLTSSSGTLVPSRPNSAVTPSENTRQAGAGLNHKPTRSSGLVQATIAENPSSWLSYVDYEGMPAQMSNEAQKHLNQHVRPISPVSALSEREYPTAKPSFEENDDFRPVSSHYSENLRYDENMNVPGSELTPPRKRSRDPLGMNPPTPVNVTRNQNPNYEIHYQNYDDKPLPLMPSRDPLRDTDANVTYHNGRITPSSRPASFVGSGGKSRFYGNLRSSVGGSNQNQLISHDDMHDILGRSGTVKTDDSGNFEVYGSDDEQEEEPVMAPTIMERNGNNSAYLHEGHWMSGEANYGNTVPQPRQVSNSTGYDLHSGYAGLDSEFGKGMARRREVSGKVAEEGRGSGGFDSREQQVDGVSSHSRKNAAPGWARFKGL